MYDENQMLQLAGIQHYMYCPRQWALIHIEQAWEDNRLTAEGNLLHSVADNVFYRQKNQGCLTLRRVQLASKELGLYGFSDCIELLPSALDNNAILHPDYPGHWRPYPIEYKHGRPKSNDCDRLQLTAQAMCLEEMYGIAIQDGALFYAATRRHEPVRFTPELRAETIRVANQMHQVYDSGKLPDVSPSGACVSCSLKNLCLPSTRRNRNVKRYLTKNLYEDTP